MTPQNDTGTGSDDGPILVLGATSGIGALTVDEALGRGLQVRGFARGADSLAPRDGLEPFADE